jgi:hypothetical protein
VAILGVAFSFAQAATVEWHFLGTAPPFAPLPSSFVTSPAAPTITDTISFIAPANGESYLNAYAAADAYGNPVISVDSTNRIVSVTFTAPLNEAIPQIVLLVGGVDGQCGPLDGGSWVFNILTNSYTFTVAGPALGIAPAGDRVVLSWSALGSNYVLQAASDVAAGSWSNITNGITTNGTGYVFTKTISSQTAYYRLKQQ